MHTLKGGWVGQTFALAKCNESDSSGKKSRIRRSKEERKAMVESFIKKHQKENNGNFPSLNLAHKEVGGSFYTVREIVREIIQENRVLGPAKLTPQEKRPDDQFSSKYPLGSIAAEPEIPLSLPLDGTQPNLVSSLNDGDDERIELSSEKHHAGKELHVINRSQVYLKNDKSAVGAEAGVVIDQLVASTFKVIDLTKVEVETFPLKSIAEGADCIQKTIGEITVSAEILDDKQNADLSSRVATINSQLCGLSSQEKPAPKVDKVEKNHARSVVAVAESNNNGGSIVAQEFPDLMGSSDSFTKNEGTIHDTENSRSLIDKESPHDASSSEEPGDIKKDTSVKDINGKSMEGTLQKTAAEESFQGTESKPKPDGPSIPKESKTTLDRINLESWEVSSRRECNPLLAIFKAFIASFMKFWSE